MNKKFAYISLFLMVFLGISSCSDEDIFTIRDSQATFTLSLPGQDVMTRAKDPGLDFFNENTVTTVDLFFYHTGETDQNAVLRKHLEGTEIARNTTSSNAETGMFVYDLTSSISINDLRTIFPNYDDNSAKHKCEVYAIVNLPANATIDATDMASLKQVELTSDAFSQLVDAANASFKKGAVPSNFVMSGQASTITLDPDNKRKLVGNIDVYRSASKVTLELTEVKQTFTDANGHEWQSQTDNISVGLKHGQKTGYVDAPQLHTISGDFKTANIHMVPGTWITGGTTEGHYKTDVPMYTYPNVWTNDLSHRTSLLVCVYWRDNTVSNSSFQPTYYEIPISDEDEQILRNYHYRIQLSIGIIGSLVEEEPVVLDHCSYVILPWGSNESILADLNQVRYLVVDETEVHMDNIISRNINFSSSHNLKTEVNVGSTENVLNKKIYYRNLSSTTATWTELPASSFRVVINNPAEGGGTSYFTIEHDLVNNMDELSDYTEFKMEFDVYHEGQDTATTEYIQHIVAYQTPMIYADVDPNSDFADASLVPTGQTVTVQIEDENGDIWVWTADENGSDQVFIHDDSRYWDWGWNYYYPQVNVGEHYDDNHTHYNAGTYRGYYQTGYWTRYTEETVDILELNDPDNHYGYTFLNGADASNMWIYYDGGYYASYGGRDANLYGGVHGLTGMNKNPNRYIIKATALTTDNFVIGDPRTTYVHNLNNNTLSSPNTNRADWAVYWSGTGYYVNNQGNVRQRTITFNAYSTRNNTNNNYLTYYHPTDENNARTARMISPEFMVASSYGVCTTGINKENARKRCASYQEDGYPAGRWRLPTQAEVEYIVQLSAWGKIPILFGILPDNANYGEDSDYWSANGVVRVNSKTGKSSSISESDASGLSVRCVYDTWYWTDKCQKDRFTWGDKETF